MGMNNELHAELMAALEVHIEGAKELGAKIDFATEPYTDEQIRQMAELGIRFRIIGNNCDELAEGIADILMGQLEKRFRESGSGTDEV